MENVLKDVMIDQLKRNDGDDILNTFSKVLNLYSIVKGNIDYVPGGMILEINMESTRMNDLGKDDMTSMIRTINSYFNKIEIQTDGLYIDFEYIFTKPQLRNKFRTAIQSAYIPQEINYEVLHTLYELREWLGEKFPKDDYIKDLNFILNYRKYGVQEKPKASLPYKDDDAL